MLRCRGGYVDDDHDHQADPTTRDLDCLISRLPTDPLTPLLKFYASLTKKQTNVEPPVPAVKNKSNTTTEWQYR